jgi:spore maturation protein CgeB
VKIVIFGLSITSSWGNGHATTFRALCNALHARGHDIVFFEHDVEWYASNRDLPDPSFCRVRIYDEWRDVAAEARRELSGADVAVVGSYFADGIIAIDTVFDSAVPVKAFYDIDTPITIAALRGRGSTDYLRADQIPGFDLYFSFTGGPTLRELEQRFGAPSAVPLYCSFDPEQYRPYPPHKRYAADFSYMGTYAPDRQPKIEEMFCTVARILPQQKFLLAGPQYPKSLRWPHNVRRITHLNPRWHARFYSSSRMTLNVTRRDMVLAGYSPSVRLFEAAACGIPIVSDNWPGLETFFEPQQEVLLPASPEDIVRYLTDYDEGTLRRIGERARERVVAEHTSAKRARQFEDAVENVGNLACPATGAQAKLVKS